MNKKSFLGVIVGATLIIAVILFVLGGYNAAPKALGRSPSYTGFGDLQRFEGQSALIDRPIQANSSLKASMGNLKRFEGQSALLDRPIQASMGNLHRYEAQPSLKVNVAPVIIKYGPPGR